MVDPLGVRASTAWVLSQARSVSIDSGALHHICETFDTRAQVPAWNSEYHFGDGTARTATYIFVLDALNFCFWSQPRWTIEYHGQQLGGYWALAASLKRAIENGLDLTDATLLSQLDEEQLARIFRGQGTIPLLKERAANAREVGHVLVRNFSGQASNLIEACRYDAAQIAGTVADLCGSFRDVAGYRGRSIQFYKRAQIFAADLFGAFGGLSWGALRGLDALTCFADYKLPQILRAWGVLRYAEPLAARIDTCAEIAAGSEEEIEIRAATVCAVEQMRDELSRRGLPLTSVQIDWALWEAAQHTVPDGKPYHHTRTIFY